jgi:caffeoyl-CoA O-methyltransferase
MRHKFTLLTPDLHEYVVAHSTLRDALLSDLAEETERLGGISAMQIAPEQGAFMTLLCRAIGARSVLEIGTFTGYSAICLARGLLDGGRLITCDVSEEWTAIARRYFARAGLSDRIDVRLGPAVSTLRAMPRGPLFDLAFIDADKPSYRSYYEEILPRLRPGGLILIDNVLWGGQVLAESTDDPNTRALQELNDFIVRDDRVDAVMLAISDGLSIVSKK